MEPATMTAIKKLFSEIPPSYYSMGTADHCGIFPASAIGNQNDSLLSFLLRGEGDSGQRSMIRLLQEVAEAGASPISTRLEAPARAIALRSDQELATQLCAALLDDDLAALLGLVRTLRQFGVIAVEEGITGPQDYALACQAGCQVLQSFWFSEAMCASATNELVATGHYPWHASP